MSTDSERIQEIAVNVASMKATVESLAKTMDRHIDEDEREFTQHDKRIAAAERKVAVHHWALGLLITGASGFAGFLGLK